MVQYDKAFRRRCGATRLSMPARLPASFTAFHTTFGVMGTSARQLFTVPGKGSGEQWNSEPT